MSECHAAKSVQKLSETYIPRRVALTTSSSRPSTSFQSAVNCSPRAFSPSRWAAPLLARASLLEAARRRLLPGALAAALLLSEAAPAAAALIGGDPSFGKDPVRPFSLDGFVSKRFLIEHLENGSVVRREKGITVDAWRALASPAHRGAASGCSACQCALAWALAAAPGLTRRVDREPWQPVARSVTAVVVDGGGPSPEPSCAQRTYAGAIDRTKDFLRPACVPACKARATFSPSRPRAENESRCALRPLRGCRWRARAALRSAPGRSAWRRGM